MVSMTFTLGGLLWVLVSSIISVALAATSKHAWTIIHQQTKESEGNGKQPSIRYGHGMLAYKGQAIVTSGYYFDRDKGDATWKSDTWGMQMTPPYKFRKLHDGISQEAVYAAYNSGSIPQAPSGRFGTGSAVRNGSLYLYGGHDGGYSRHGRQNYEPGYDFDELWRFDIKPATWTHINPKPPAKTPGKRYLLGATVVADKFVLYGGIGENQGDVWSFDLHSYRWEQLAPEIPISQGGPGRRVGHDIVPVDFPSGQRGFILYGGRTVLDGESILHQDVWFFDVINKSWRKLVNTTESPPGRKYHAMTHTHLHDHRSGTSRLVGLAIGGSETTPGLTCATDVWAFTVDCRLHYISWTRLPDFPFGVYDFNAAAGGGAVYTFGGHLCTSSVEGFPYYYVNVVARLELEGLIPQQMGCLISTQALESQLAEDESMVGKPRPAAVAEEL